MNPSLRLYKELSYRIKQKNMLPIWWLEGEEPFFIEELLLLAASEFIPPPHRSFNQQILFGQDTAAVDLISTCQRAPMGYDTQLVIVHNGHLLKNSELLVWYIKKPNPSCTLIISTPRKKLDKRTALAKSLSISNFLFSFGKLYPNQIHEWISMRAIELQITLSREATRVLVEHLGNQLSFINQELKKIKLNVKNRTVHAEDVYLYVGINKMYNIFELQKAIGEKNKVKAYEIAQYFQQNEKTFPLQLTLTMLHSFFSKLYLLYGEQTTNKNTLASSLGVSPFFVGDYISAKRHFSFDEVCHCILLLNEGFRASVGLRSYFLDTQRTLLSELLFKIFHSSELAVSR